MSGELLRSYIDMLDEENEDASAKVRREVTEAFDTFSSQYSLDGIKEQVMELVNAEIDRQVTEQADEEVTEQTDEEVTDETEEVTIIYPQKKPVTFQKKIDKSVAKSTILSSLNLEGQALKAAEQNLSRHLFLSIEDIITVLTAGITTEIGS